MLNKIEKELKELSIITSKELIEAYEKGEIREYVDENALSIQRDEDNDISQIVFTIGSPYVHLDLYGGNAGCVVAEDLEHIIHSAIPWKIWFGIKDELEEIDE